MTKEGRWHPWTLTIHLKGRRSINLVFFFLLLYCFLEGEKLPVCEDDGFVPVLCATGRDALLLCVRTPSKQELRRCSFERRCALMCRSSLTRHDLSRYVQLLGHDLLFLEWISANPLPYCFDSGFSPHTFQASWPSPVFNTPEILIPFNCPIDEISRNFQLFQEFENLII